VKLKTINGKEIHIDESREPHCQHHDIEYLLIESLENGSVYQCRECGIRFNKNGLDKIAQA
jgi:hypothetical protein